MAQEPSQESAKTGNTGGRFARAAILAAVLGLAAGAGLYAFYGMSGNAEMTASGPANADIRDCEPDRDVRARLENAATGDVAAFQPLDRAESVGELSFQDDKGEIRKLGDWRGKLVLFNLWATWCAPCRAEMPALDALQARLGGNEFDVVAVSVDLGAADKPKKFYRDIGMKNAGFFHDGEMTTLNDLRKKGLALGLPTTMLVSRKGCALGVLNGPAEWAGEDAVNLVRAAL